MQQPDEPPGFLMLDEPEQTARDDGTGPQRAEMLLGLVLILVVIGWSLWVWHQQQQINAYNMGKHSAAARDWDQALAGYRAAGDYADSATLARQAMSLVEERDTRYAGATAAITAGDWIAALQDLRALRDIQSGYLDSSALYSEAEDNTYRGALTGVVALRVAVVPAGLYMRNEQEWVWLPGSDVTSSLVGYGSGGCLVYDVPVGSPNLDNTAASPNLFATSVLSLDLTPPSRGLMSAHITAQRSGGANATVDAVLDTALPSTEPAGEAYCGGVLAQRANPTSSAHLHAGFTAYIDNGALHVRDDSNKIDLLLEQGVQRLFDTAP